MLDPDYLNRAAPPGSMRYFALLYAQAEQRELLTALFVVDAEIRAAIQVAHEVAHTRVQWWRTEIDRLINRNAQHPATKLLQIDLPTADWSILHELLVAADMDLARMTYHTAAELNGYLERSGGVIFDVFSQDADPDCRRHARQLGALIRRIETVRDLATEARAGRVYWSLDELDAKNISVEQLKSATPEDAVCTLLAAEVAKLSIELAQLTSAKAPPVLRPLLVLASLHAQLLRRIERANHDVFTRRHELGPLEKVWTAWRTARKS